MTARGVRDEAREPRRGMQEKERLLSMIRAERACCGDGQRAVREGEAPQGKIWAECCK